MRNLRLHCGREKGRECSRKCPYNRHVDAPHHFPKKKRGRNERRKRGGERSLSTNEGPMDRGKSSSQEGKKTSEGGETG